MDEALDAAERFARRAGRRVTIAWVLIEGRTDEIAQAEQLAQRTAGRPFKVNLIPWNPLDDSRLEAADEASVLAFQAVLADAGVPGWVLALPDTLCDPCVTDADCVAPGSRCIDIGTERYCGRSCASGSPFSSRNISRWAAYGAFSRKSRNTDSPSM